MSTPPYLNRELSWLEFNQRVLDEASDPTVPLADRLKFTAITSKNLDEFFMVRVGGLTRMSRNESSTPDATGLTPATQLENVHQRAQKMTQAQYSLWADTLCPLLDDAGVKQLAIRDLAPKQRTHIDELFDREIFPTLTPMILEDGPSDPRLTNQTIYTGARMQGLDDQTESRFGVVPLGSSTPRLIPVPSPKRFDYVLLDDIIEHYIDRFFVGSHILETATFRVTRNADVSVSDEFGADLVSEMVDVLTARLSSDCIRLEISSNASRTYVGLLQKRLSLDPDMIYYAPGPLDLGHLMDLAQIRALNSPEDIELPPLAAPTIDPSQSMFDNIADHDILLHHPFQSFDPVVDLIEQAAADPDVLAIKQILYRTSADSRIVNALIAAARSGKTVTALVELKARFDEARNVGRARELENAGAQVIYGIKGYKTHAKLCIIVRREPRGIVRYMHFGTGNYKESTARLYTDLSYLSCNPALGADASMFFNTICGYSQPQDYSHIAAAPLTLRSKLLTLIESETERARQGRKAHIMAKLNSLVDTTLIDALYTASQAGVKIELNIRGICCLRPGVRGLSETITVISIIDRFLEHSRMFFCHHGGEELLFISSADWMPRNLDRRIELLVPILDRDCHKQALTLLRTFFKDNQKARKQLANGRSKRVKPSKQGKPFRAQHELYQSAAAALKEAQKKNHTFFAPHLPSPQDR